MGQAMGEANSRRATLGSVAAAVGVSAKTVSNAYNQPDQLSATLRERILSVAREQGYAGPAPAARAFRRGRSGMIGVLYANPLSYAFDDPAAVAFLAGLAEGLDTQDLGISLLSGSAGTARSADGLGRAVIDGVVAYSLAGDDPALDAVRHRGLPVVHVDQPRLPGAPWVGIDDRAAARDIAGRLVAAGHRRIGIVSFGLSHAVPRVVAPLPDLPPVTLEVTARRLAGYADALAGVVAPADILVSAGIDSTAAEGRAAARALLDRQPDLTALICLSDRLAAGVVAELTDRGVAIPDDVSLIGFDGTSPDTAGVALSTVRQPHRDKGRVAARLLLAALAGEQPDAVTLPYEVVAGTTVAAPR